MNIIYKNKAVEVSMTGRDYDFIAVVENNTDENLVITFNGLEEDYLAIPANDWVGILADSCGRRWVEAFKSKNFEIESYNNWKDEHGWLVA